jgi:hypothetical protein
MSGAKNFVRRDDRRLVHLDEVRSSGGGALKALVQPYDLVFDYAYDAQHRVPP